MQPELPAVASGEIQGLAANLVLEKDTVKTMLGPKKVGITIVKQQQLKSLHYMLFILHKMCSSVFLKILCWETTMNAFPKKQ